MKEMIIAAVMAMVLITPIAAAQGFELPFLTDITDSIGGFIDSIVTGITDIPQVIGGWIGAITGQNNYCEEDPYNSICICNADENKMSHQNKHYCENTELLFNPMSATFDADTWAYARETLTSIEPNCDMACTGGEIISSPLGVSTSSEGDMKRIVMYECKMPWTRPWSIIIGVEEGVTNYAFCTIPTPPIPGIDSATITLEDSRAFYDRGVFRQMFRLEASCFENSGKATITINTPNGFVADTWAIGPANWNIIYDGNKWIGTSNFAPVIAQQYRSCSITSSDIDSAVLTCDIGCPSTSQSGLYTIWAYSADQVGACSFQITKDDGIETSYKPIGSSICCNTISKQMYCRNGGDWELDTTAGRSCAGGTESGWIDQQVTTGDGTVYDCL